PGCPDPTGRPSRCPTERRSSAAAPSARCRCARSTSWSSCWRTDPLAPAASAAVAGPTRQRRIVVADDADRLGHVVPQIASGGHDADGLVPVSIDEAEPAEAIERRGDLLRPGAGEV